jgi:hypothetical protein
MPRAVNVGFLVDTVAMRQVSLQVLQFSPASVIPPMLHIHLDIIYGMDNGLVSGHCSRDTVSLQSSKVCFWFIETGTNNVNL